MSGTYRQRMMYVCDGVGSYGHHKARSKDKDIDRRIKRREHARITRDATESWYADAADDLFEYLSCYNPDDDYLNGDSGYYDDHPGLYDDYDLYLQEEDNRANQGFYDDPMDYYCDPYYDDYGFDPIQDRVIQHDDAGRSLGDILQEIIDRREGK